MSHRGSGCRESGRTTSGVWHCTPSTAGSGQATGRANTAGAGCRRWRGHGCCAGQLSLTSTDWSKAFRLVSDLILNSTFWLIFARCVVDLSNYGSLVLWCVLIWTVSLICMVQVNKSAGAGLHDDGRLYIDSTLELLKCPKVAFCWRVMGGELDIYAYLCLKFDVNSINLLSDIPLGLSTRLQ